MLLLSTPTKYIAVHISVCSVLCFPRFREVSVYLCLVSIFSFIQCNVQCQYHLPNSFIDFVAIATRISCVFVPVCNVIFEGS